MRVGSNNSSIDRRQDLENKKILLGNLLLQTLKSKDQAEREKSQQIEQIQNQQQAR